MGDLFPGKSATTTPHDHLQRGLAAAVKALGVQSLAMQATKVDQLHETMEVGNRIPKLGDKRNETPVCSSFARSTRGTDLH